MYGVFAGLAPDIPEDLYYMIKKAVVMRKHLEQNRKDKDGKFRLILVESRIHRLARYYKVRQSLSSFTPLSCSSGVQLPYSILDVLQSVAACEEACA